MICKLCHKEAELQNSHIIPEFQYKPLYDEKHRFQVISANPEKREYYEQKGFREKLLCPSCETKISRWESYANKVIFGDEAQIIEKTDGFIRLGNISYVEFKLFLLSLLWRMGVSTLKNFSAVQLGPYEEKLRLHLLNEDPGLASDYPCFITAVLFRGRFYADWIIPPDLIRYNEAHCYRTLISGVLYTFLVTEKTLPIGAQQIAISKQGNFSMIVDRVENIEFLRKFVSQFSKALNERKEDKKI